MSSSRRSFMLGATVVATTVPARTQTHVGGVQWHQASDHQSAFSSEMHRQMRSMAEAMERASMIGTPDRDFLAMMIPHHQGAVAMAQLVLVHGQDPLTRQLAEEIIASQQAEIYSMQARLRALESGGAPDAEGFPALTGTRGRGQ